MTWKPRPDAGPPSAWIDTAASARGAVADRGALGDARPPTGVGRPREHDRGAGRPQHPAQPNRHVPGERRLRVARRRRRSRRVAGLPQRARVDEPVDLLGMRPVAAVVPGVDRDRRSVERRAGGTGGCRGARETRRPALPARVRLGPSGARAQDTDPVTCRAVSNTPDRARPLESGKLPPSSSRACSQRCRRFRPRFDSAHASARTRPRSTSRAARLLWPPIRSPSRRRPSRCCRSW